MNSARQRCRFCKWSHHVKVYTKLLPLVALLSLPAALPAQFTFATNNGALAITGYTGDGGAVVIPNTFEGLPVTSIGNAAFLNHSNITSLVVATSITNIADEGIRGCSGLTNVTLGEGLVSIGFQAFRLCSNLPSITIPKNVSHVGDNVFHSCLDLTNIAVDTLNPVYSSRDGVLFDKDQTTIFQCPAGKTGTYHVPDTVLTITNRSFWDVALTNVVIGTNVTSIRQAAFRNCLRLTRVIIPSSVTTLGASPFTSCENLVGIYFLGNAPPNISSLDPYSTNLVVYYLPGRTGWGSSFGGHPTALWRPEVLTADASFGFTTNQFGFNVKWANGMTVVVDACTNLGNPVWTPLKTNILTTDTLYFSDPQWAIYSARFYRLRWR